MQILLIWSVLCFFSTSFILIFRYFFALGFDDHLTSNIAGLLFIVHVHLRTSKMYAQRYLKSMDLYQNFGNYCLYIFMFRFIPKEIQNNFFFDCHLSKETQSFYLHCNCFTLPNKST